MSSIVLHMIIILWPQSLAISTEQGCAPRNNCLETYQTWHVSSHVVRDNYLCAALV